MICIKLIRKELQLSEEAIDNLLKTNSNKIIDVMLVTLIYLMILLFNSIINQVILNIINIIIFNIIVKMMLIRIDVETGK